MTPELEQKLRDTLVAFKAEWIGVNPDWEPLHKLLPPDWWHGWMYMGRGEDHQSNICLYKHGITRRYLCLDENGNCYSYYPATRRYFHSPNNIDPVLAAYENIADFGATPSTIYDSEYKTIRNAALADAGYTVLST